MSFSALVMDDTVSALQVQYTRINGPLFCFNNHSWDAQACTFDLYLATHDDISEPNDQKRLIPLKTMSYVVGFLNCARLFMNS